MSRKFIPLFLLLLLPLLSQGQTTNVGIGTTTPDSSAQLDISSGKRGVLFPRLTTAQRNAIVNPATGLVIFNTSNNALEYNSGTPASPVWQTLTANNIPVISGSAPTGTTIGQLIYNTNTSNGLGTGIYYWDGSQWVTVATPTAAITNNYKITNNDSLINNGPIVNNNTVVNNGSFIFNKTATFNDSAIFNGTIQVGGRPQGLLSDSVLVFEPTTKVMRRISTSDISGYLTNVNLTSSTTPAGTTVGQVYYNTNSTSGLPVGPVYWDGSKWLAIITTASTAVSNTSSANTLTTTVNGVSGTGVSIVNSNTAAWTQSGGLTSTVNGVAAAVTPASGTISNILGYDAGGAPVYQSAASVLSASTSVSNNSSSNTLTTTVNGITGAGVNIISSNTLTAGANTITSTVNGVASPAVTVPNLYTADGSLTAARTVTLGANNLTFSGTGNVILNSGNVGVGTSTPAYKLDVSGTAAFRSLSGGSRADSVVVADATSGQLKRRSATAIQDSRLKFFYAPTISIPLTATGTFTVDLYNTYFSQFNAPAVASTGAPASIPTYANSELNYYITTYDNTVLSNVSISNTGVMTYTVISTNPSTTSYVNVVFTVK